MTSILLAEDDLRLAGLVQQYLSGHGYQVDVISDGLMVGPQLQEAPPSILVLDINLPGKDGLSICREARTYYSGPILMLTARDSDIDQVLGFEYGADDYVIKPAEPRVLLARIQALLRRCQSNQQLSHLQYGDFRINPEARQVSVAGQALELSSHDFDLLWHLAANAGRIMSREQLFSLLYNREYDGLDRSIDVRISVLRKKLNDDPDHASIIKTVWGKGYLFVADSFR